MRNLRFFFATASVFFFSSCGNTNEPNPGDPNTDRAPMLINWVDNLVVPSYDIFQEKFDAMVLKSQAFTAAPSESALAELRTAWAEAYVEWQNVDVFQFGPADRYTLRDFFNIYPADVTGINNNIQNPTANLELPASHSQQGFPALDYLINGVADTDAAIVALYSTDADAEKRRNYLTKIVTRMNTLITTVINEWPSHRESFISKTGLDMGSSIGLVINAYVFYYERFIRSGKFGIPSGVMVSSTGSPQPGKVEGLYKQDLSQLMASTANKAALRFFTGEGRTNGTEGPSLKSYLDALDAGDTSTGELLSTTIENQFILVQQKIDALPPDFVQLVNNNNQEMIDVFTEMQKLVRLLKVDMSSAMSVSIVYNDTDGD